MKKLLLYLFLFAVPFSIFHFISVANRGLKPAWLFAIGLIVLFTLDLFLHRDKIKKSTTGLAVLGLNAAAILSLINLFNASGSQMIDFSTQWFQLILFSLLFFVITSLRVRSMELRSIFRIWIFLAFILSLYAIYQVFARPRDLPLAYLPIINPSFGGSFTRGGAFGSYIRPSSVFAEPSFFAQYLISPMLLLGVPLLFYGKKSRRLFFSNYLVNWILFLTMIVAYLLSFAMGGYVALAGVVMMLLLNRRTRRKTLAGILIFCILFTFVSYAAQPVLNVNFAKMVIIRTIASVRALITPAHRAKLESPYARTSIHNRYYRAKAAVTVWAKSPFIGVGLNNFGYYYPPNIAPAVHSGFIQILAELGIVGFSGLIILFGSIILRIKKYISRADGSTFQSILLTAFYYIIWARIFYTLIAGNWLNVKLWFDISITVLVLNHFRVLDVGETSLKSSGEQTKPA